MQLNTLKTQLINKMSDNKDGEYLVNPKNLQSENPLEKVILIKDSEVISQNQENKDMEAHKHPRPVTHEKKWSGYVFEFLMLFLAVFLGFLAENYREHLTEKGIEKRNIESLIHNLESDKFNLTTSIKFCEEKTNAIDSLTKISGNFSDQSYQKAFVHYVGKLVATDGYKPDESAFLQMQSSNTLRLITKQNVLDSIINYHQGNISLLEQQSAVNKSFDATLVSLAEIIDLRSMQSQSLEVIGNNQQIQKYVNYKIIEGSQTKNYVYNFLEHQLQSATTLIKLLKKEYSIK
jgi:hypothetical protein